MSREFVPKRIERKLDTLKRPEITLTPTILTAIITNKDNRVRIFPSYAGLFAYVSALIPGFDGGQIVLECEVMDHATGTSFSVSGPLKSVVDYLTLDRSITLTSSIILSADIPEGVSICCAIVLLPLKAKESKHEGV